MHKRPFFSKLLIFSAVLFLVITLGSVWSLVPRTAVSAAACPVTDGGAGDGDSTVNGVITINANTTWTANDTNLGAFDCTGVDILVTNNAILYLDSREDGDTDYTDDFGVHIYTDDLTVNSGARISSNSLGYAAALGPGAGTTRYSSGGGGGHGGYGAYGTIWNSDWWPPGGAPYGSLREPVTLGSGGGNATDEPCYYGAPGGGAIQITASTVTVDGTISANGGNGCVSGQRGSGGGAGGSIFITTTTFAGGGSMAANGGNGGNGSYNDGGGGSGGRISVIYDETSYSGSISMIGSSSPTVSESGTSVLVDDTNHGLYIKQSQKWRPSGTTAFEDTFPDITHVYVQNNASLQLYGGNRSTADSGYGWTLDVDSLEVSAGSSINLDALGYSATYGPGGGSSQNRSGGGAGYGGYGSRGTNGSSGTPAGSPYGSIRGPTDLGSGGGNATDEPCYYGGSGGGAIKVTASNVVINGTISANGKNGCVNTQRGSGGGSGGSIWIETSDFSGGGIIRANGGNGGNGSYYDGGGGSGGRISINYETSSFSGSVTANGASTPVAADPGTYISVDDTNHELHIRITQRWVPSSATDFEDTFPEIVGVYVENGATLKLQGGNRSTSDAGYGWTFDVEDFEIASGSSINMDALGYTATLGPGGGSTGVRSGGGAGYGGYGSRGTNGGSGTPAGSPHGSIREPTDLGSGGGNATDEPCYYGGAGGGAIHIVATNVVINGTISANGQNGCVNDQRGSGGGSGGSIWIDVTTFSGGGILRANGGRGGDGSIYDGGGGSGGRISINYESSSFAGSVISNGATSPVASDPGTTILVDNINHELHIGTPQRWVPTGTTDFEDIFPEITDVYIENGATLKLEGGNRSTADAGYGWSFDVEVFEIEAGSSINMDALGYIAATGPGAGSTQNRSGGGGAYGGYGGYGTNGGSGTPGGSPYGSAIGPVDLGSGGGNAIDEPCYYGGAGGGAVKIIADSVLIDGTISADGQNGCVNTQRGSGGGAGGSVWIGAGLLSGSGSITVDGGTGGNGSYYDGGGGSGGRIFLGYYESNSYIGTPTATLGWVGTNGTNGTVIINGIPGSGSNLGQYGSDGLTAIPVGDFTNESEVVLKVLMSDGDVTDTLTPEVEFHEVGTDFTDVATDVGDPVAFAGTAVDGLIEVTGLSDTKNYHWQTRVCDVSTYCSPWRPFGGNLEDEGDLIVDLSDPIDPDDVISVSHSVWNWSNDSTIDLTWTDGVDVTSGVEGYSYTWGTSSNIVPDDTLDINVGVGCMTSPALDTGESYYYSMRTKDYAGNWTSTVHIGPFLIDTVDPTGSVSINGGDESTETTEVDLSLDASDADSGVEDMIICNDETFSGCDWETDQTSKAWSLDDGVGMKTVYVKFRDYAGNESETVSDSILLEEPADDEEDGVEGEDEEDGDQGDDQDDDQGDDEDDQGDDEGGLPETGDSGDEEDSIYVDEGSEFETDDSTPTFRGLAPPGTVVQVEIVSPGGALIELGEVTSNDEGEWVWTAGEELDSGSYTVVIGYNYSDGSYEEKRLGLTVEGDGDGGIFGDGEDIFTRIITTITTTYTTVITSFTTVWYYKYLLLFFSLMMWVVSMLTIMGLSPSDIPSYFEQARLWILHMLGLRSKGQPWGVVYDSVTKDLLSRAVVRMYDGTSDELLGSAVTDSQGVFSYEVRKGTYRLEARRGGYVFPSEVVTGGNDGPRRNVYNGGEYEVESDKEAVRMHMPMDREGVRGSVKLVTKIATRIYGIFTVLTPILLVVSTYMSYRAFMMSNLRMNAIFFFVYFGMLISYVVGLIRERTKWGYVLDEEVEPVEGVEVGIYDDKYGLLVDTRVSDERGRFRFVVPGGEYVLKVEGIDWIPAERGYEAGYIVGKDVKGDQQIIERVIVRRNEI